MSIDYSGREEKNLPSDAVNAVIPDNSTRWIYVAQVLSVLSLSSNRHRFLNRIKQLRKVWQCREKLLFTKDREIFIDLKKASDVSH
jgi:hypothetical protein